MAKVCFLTPSDRERIRFFQHGFPERQTRQEVKNERKKGRKR